MRLLTLLIALGFFSPIPAIAQESRQVIIDCAEDSRGVIWDLATSVAQAVRFSEKGVRLTDNMAQRLRDSGAFSGCDESLQAQVADRPFTVTERAIVERVVQKFEPWLRCSNHPLWLVGRASKSLGRGPDGACRFDDRTAGVSVAHPQAVRLYAFIVLYDSATETTGGTLDFEGVVAHELAHALTTHFDPRSCKRFRNPLRNPIAKDWIRQTGWDTTGTSLVTPADWNDPPTAYARTSAWEDMAESARLFLQYPEKLKKASPIRYQFMEKLFRLNATSGASP